MNNEKKKRELNTKLKDEEYDCLTMEKLLLLYEQIQNHGNKSCENKENGKAEE